jgi:uncharacterized cupredoxin-like copper-binding protein
MMRPALAGLALACFFATAAHAENQTTVRVSLLDMTALFGSSGTEGYGRGMMGPGGYGPGQGMGPGYGGPGYGMMGPGYGMMGGGMMGHGMMSIRVDKSTVAAGKVEFDVTNLSRSIVHELMVVAVDSPNAPLPYDYNTWRVDEKQIKILGETEDMRPNVTKKLDVTLSPGSYLLVCNVPGHYAAGMVTAFTVTTQ